MKQEQARMTPSEAVFGFASWLTTRDKAVTMGAAHECGIVAELVDEWCKANNLDATRDGVYPDNITFPEPQH